MATIYPGSPGHVLFSQFGIVSGVILIFQKCPSFWPSLIDCGEQGCSCSLSTHGMQEPQESC